MAYPLASTPYTGSHPNPPFSGNYIPEIWSTRLLMKFYATTLLAKITNNLWEGEIKEKGDIVRIRQIPNVTVRDHQIDGALVTDRPSVAATSFTIDRGKYFQVVLDDVYKVQMDVNYMDMVSQDFANQLRIAIETDVLAAIYADVPTANKGATAGAISANVNLGVTGTPLKVTTNPSQPNDVDPVRLLLRLNQVLTEQNVPPDGQWYCVVPAWFAQLLKPSDLKDVSLTGDDKSPLRTGAIGRVDNMVVYVSNLLPKFTDGSVTPNVIYAGHPYAVTFATQYKVTEEFRSQLTFGTIMRSLQVYGFKTIKPEALAAAYAYGPV